MLKYHIIQKIKAWFQHFKPSQKQALQPPKDYVEPKEETTTSKSHPTHQINHFLTEIKHHFEKKGYIIQNIEDISNTYLDKESNLIKESGYIISYMEPHSKKVKYDVFIESEKKTARNTY
jgi:hypothetical protein